MSQILPILVLYLNYTQNSVSFTSLLPQNISGQLFPDKSDIGLITALINYDIADGIIQAQNRLRRYIKARGKCFSGVLKHLAGVICLYCDSNYAGKGVSLSNSTYSLKLSKDVCTKLQSDCFEFLQAAYAINENNLFLVNMQTLTDLNSTIQAIIASPLTTQSFFNITFLLSLVDKRQAIINNLLIKYPFYLMPESCLSESSCSFICEKFLTFFGLNISGLLNGTRYIPTNNLTRVLQSIQTRVSFADSGFDSYLNGEISGLNTTNEGNGGFAMFNFSGNATEKDLGIDTDSKKFSSIIPFFSFIYLSFLLFLLI